MPSVAGGRLSGAFNVVPLDAVVTGVLDVAMGNDGESASSERGTEDGGSRKGLHFLHHVGDEELRLQELQKWAIEGGAGGEGEGGEEGQGQGQGQARDVVEEVELAE